MHFTFRPGYSFLLLLFFIFGFTACNVEKQLFPSEKFLFLNQVSVKNYHTDTPFVFYNTIELDGNIRKDQQNRLKEELSAYWDDSLYAARVRKFGVFFSLKNPPIFDSSNFIPTIKFMNSYLFSKGFFNPLLRDTFMIDTFYKSNKPPQIRTYAAIIAHTGSRTLIDSLGIDIQDSTLQSLAAKNLNGSFIQPGKTAYSKEVIAAELDRMVVNFRNNGYFQMRRENLIAEVDTTDLSLLKLTADPFDLAIIIAEAERKTQESPSAILTIKDRRSVDTAYNAEDSLAFTQFYIGNIHYYPETRQISLPDSIMKDTASYRKLYNENFTIFYNQGLFKENVFREHLFMQPGSLYNEEKYYRTANDFNQMGAWRQVDTRTVLRQDTIDFHFFLYPAKKRSITYNLEASRNTGDFLSSSNFFGLSFNITYRNYNVWKRAIQSSTNLRNGVELSFNQGRSGLQSLQSSLNHTYSFPKLITPFKLNKLSTIQSARTIFNINASYSERKDFFRLRSIVSNWGYEWKKNGIAWGYRPLNIELYSLDTLPLLLTAFQSNPFLRTSFNTGSVISQQINMNYAFTGKNTNVNNYIRISLEESGLILGRIKSLQKDIYQYVKLETEYRKSVNLANSNVVAFRFFGGIGYNYSNDAVIGKTLPFFKQFVAGGPNSMRAWGLRLLGLGSSLLSDTSTTFRDRYGDVQLETNVEYRYPILHFSSVDIKGAIFTDIGNIWNLRTNPNNPEAIFNFNKLGKDIAIGIGTGVRLDFNFFLIRVDLGIKLKDPARLENNGWLDITNFTWRNNEFQKFDNRGNLIRRNNYAIQLGIGLPF